ncbi:MAG: NAD(P)-dependent oxidoreductase [Candidatus Zixiibacteriota bacterium]
MSSCVLFGGAGFVGTHLTKRFLESGRFSHVHIADIQPSPLRGMPGVTSSITDVRRPIPRDMISESPEWIFNLAAIHREPGHEDYEYFETNLTGARTVCEYADSVNCRNIHFTSSISVYGPTTGPTVERSPIRPSTPYGASKYPAELIHEAWQRSRPGRRLLISRPGVLYGPGDPGNIMRMIKAIKRGYFAFPCSPGIFKSYGYIYGFLDSIEFTMDQPVDLITYNYAESPTQSLGELVSIIKSFCDCKAVVFPVPLWVLLPISELVQRIFGFKNPIHPVRVRKAATPTHIVPQVLHDMKFNFRYNFEGSLRHWQSVAPEDFGPELTSTAPPGKLRFAEKQYGREATTQPASRHEITRQPDRKRESTLVDV